MLTEAEKAANRAMMARVAEVRALYKRMEQLLEFNRAIIKGMNQCLEQYGKDSQAISDDIDKWLEEGKGES